MENRVVSPAEMKLMLLKEPKKFPLMVLNRMVSGNRLLKLQAQYHIFQVQYKFLTYNAQVPNYYRIPPVAKLPEKQEDFEKTVKEYNPKSVRNIFEIVVEDGDETYMLINPDTSHVMMNYLKSIYLVGIVEFEKRQRYGVHCTYHKGMPELNLGANQAKIISVTPSK